VNTTVRCCEYNCLWANCLLNIALEFANKFA
jgi:hypothetical protein